MKNYLLLLVAFLLQLLTINTNFAQQTCKEVIGYYPGWQWYDRGKLVKPTTIQYSKYNILNYAFFKPLADGSIEGTDSWADENVLKGQINWSTTPTSYYPNTSLIDLAHNANVKVLISVGGWTLSDLFPSIAADATKRANFAHHCRLLITTYNLDGIDIDWEYPGYAEHNGTAADKQNYTTFVHQIRDTLTALTAVTNKTYLLTSCFGASQANMSNIEWNNILQYIDAINLMSYDFFGAWETTTNHNAPLTAPAQGESTFNISSAVNWLINNYNVPPSKINAGVAFYGRSQKTVGTPGLHVAGTGTADTGTFFEDDGSPMYYNVLKNISSFTDHWDETAQVPYLTGNGTLKTFVSYDNKESIARKASYIVNQNLRGAIIWEITGDYIETSPGSGVIAGTPLVDTLNAVFCNSTTPNAAPTVSLTAPANNSTYAAPANIIIKANAADSDGTIAKIEFYQGSNLLGTDLTSPYSFTWGSVAAGSYSITAKAYDNNGKTTISTPRNVVVYNNTVPTVTITAPATNSFYLAPATINLAATASDAEGTIKKVVFYNGPTILGTDLTAPYTFTWANVATGVYSNIRARAYDNNNASAYSAPIKVTVLAAGSNLPPSVSITNPLANSSFLAPASITINAVANDQDGTITKVRFYNGTTLLGTDLTAPYSFTWNNVATGTYNIKAIATDNSNANTTSSIISINVVNNVPPTVALTSPSNNSYYFAPATIPISATATDDGSIIKVEFYNDNTLINTDSSAPYQYNWANVPVGIYNIKAKAYDNFGSSAMTGTNTVNVTASPTITCSSPATFYFNNNNYIPLGEIKLGQGRLYPVWGVSADAYIPTNRLNWAISMVHAAHLFRNVTGTDKIPVDFYFATAAKESFCGCDQSISTASGQVYPFTYQAASVGDGCFQIEGNSAYNELIQEYPQRYPVGQHPNLIGGHNYETAALSKAYYDIFTIKYWEVSKGWNPIQFFNTAADPDASIKLMAVAYNRGLWYTGLGNVLNTDRNNAIVSPNISPYFADNNYGYDYQKALTNYCKVLTNNSNQLEASLVATNPATNQPYNYFDNYYNPMVSWSDMNAYIDSIAVLYPEINIANVKTAVQNTFNSINTGNAISFRYQLGQVLNTLMLQLPADDPTTNVATNYGCASTVSNGGSNTCSAPSALTASNIANTSATISWTSTATNFNLQYKTSNVNTWTTVNVSGNSYNLTGLTACSAYSYQVQAVCSNTSSSVYSAANTFNTIGCTNACNIPSNLSVSNISNNAVTLNWATVSGATSYNIQYKASNSSTWTTINTSNNTYNLSGLAACTNYAFKVQTVCTTTSSSAYSSETAFASTGCTTPGPAPTTYCSAYSLNSTSEWIQSITVGNYTKNSGNNSGFGNFIDQTITVAMGSTVNLSLTPGFPSGTSQDEYWKIWIDFNRDGDLSDAGEEVFSNHGVAALTGSFIVPTNASYGYARCRIAMKRGVYPGICDIYSNGEVEDYQILLNQAAAALMLNPNNIATQNKALTVFPNPGNANITLQFDLIENDDLAVSITDINGAVVYQQAWKQIAKGNQQIAINGLENLTNGIYLISLRGSKQLIGNARWVKF